MTIPEGFGQDAEANGKALTELRDDLAQVGTAVALSGEDEDAVRKAIKDAYTEKAACAGIDIPNAFIPELLEICVRLAIQNAQGYRISTGPDISFD